VSVDEGLKEKLQHLLIKIVISIINLLIWIVNSTKIAWLFFHRVSLKADTERSKAIFFGVRFEVFVAVKIKFVVFWVVMPCSMIVGYQRFRGLCWLCL
jgi:hypothetical protein